MHIHSLIWIYFFCYVQINEKNRKKIVSSGSAAAPARLPGKLHEDEDVVVVQHSTLFTTVTKDHTIEGSTQMCVQVSAGQEAHMWGCGEKSLTSSCCPHSHRSEHSLTSSVASWKQTGISEWGRGAAGEGCLRRDEDDSEAHLFSAVEQDLQSPGLTLRSTAGLRSTDRCGQTPGQPVLHSLGGGGGPLQSCHSAPKCCKPLIIWPVWDVDTKSSSERCYARMVFLALQWKMPRLWDPEDWSQVQWGRGAEGEDCQCRDEDDSEADLFSVRQYLCCWTRPAETSRVIAQTRVQGSLSDPRLVSGALTDVVKHQSNLSVRVWENMKEEVRFSLAILDPNSCEICYVRMVFTTLWKYSSTSKGFAFKVLLK